MAGRRARLLAGARRLGCDALVALEPENLFYMTGFWGEAAGILEAGGRLTVVAPELEAGRAREEARGADVAVAGRGAALIPEVAGRLRGRRACTDCRDYASVRRLRRAAPGTVQSAEPFARARAVKDAGELAVMRRASRIIDGMFGLCAERMRRGMRETELQAELMAHAVSEGMFDTGYRSTLNPLIVAGGPNGALPHAQPTARRLAAGDLVVVDITLRHRGYVSDATRTFGIGRIPDAAREAYDVVRESQRLGAAAARPGAACAAVDAACRDRIAAAGLGGRFVHSTGHGVGLDVHEPPAISPRGPGRLAAGMAVTVEPGVYEPGRFGVRIEDTLAVGGRPASMHRFTRELVRV